MAKIQKGAKLPPLSERLARIGLVKDWDFVLHLPLRYEDETRITPIAGTAPGAVYQIQGRVSSCHIRQFGYGREQLVAHVADETGEMQVRLLHFYPSSRTQFAEGSELRLLGEVREGYGGVLEMVHPRVKKAAPDDTALPSTLTPVYPAGEGITQPWLRKRIDRAILDVDIIDIVPKKFLEPLDLPGLKESIDTLHHPKPGADLAAYDERSTKEWRRLKFDELLAQQIALRESRSVKDSILAHPILTGQGDLVRRLVESLPFQLTGAQKRVWREIVSDLSQRRPMQRLLQGDVGSGKTIVAAMAAALAVQNGYQAAFMAPTEILAEQHYRKIKTWLEPLGVKILWLAGSLKPKEKAERQKALEQGEFQIAVGTHALIQNAVRYKNLALAIIDEQHRFGVSQRLKLRETDSESRMPHMLMLSATPIPRTLAMSYLADVDVSVIDELPPGRTPITTRLVNLSRIEELESAIDNAIGTGGQCYWVCPLIEESEKADLTAATMRAQYLADRHPEWRVGLVHGALTAEQKHAVMEHFSSGDLDLLVATTVIEVGVDVPNASLMVIEHAERFGLAQLHQLRGRVGRGSAVSYCFMLYDPRLSEVGRERLLVIREHTDGFVIAREDLKLRGPGEFLGARQSGQPMLRFADIQTDADLLEAARNAAAEWLRQDREKAALHARRWFSSRENYLDA